jgi:hypothetical protein
MGLAFTHSAMPIFRSLRRRCDTKFFSGGRYATQALVKFVRDNPVLSLEEAHWRLSAHPAILRFCA